MGPAYFNDEGVRPWIGSPSGRMLLVIEMLWPVSSPFAILIALVGRGHVVEEALLESLYAESKRLMSTSHSEPSSG